MKHVNPPNFNWISQPHIAIPKIAELKDICIIGGIYDPSPSTLPIIESFLLSINRNALEGCYSVSNGQAASKLAQFASSFDRSLPWLLLERDTSEGTAKL